MKPSILRLVLRHIYNWACVYRHKVTASRCRKVAAHHSSLYNPLLFCFSSLVVPFSLWRIFYNDSPNVGDDVIKQRSSAWQTVYLFSHSLKEVAITWLVWEQIEYSSEATKCLQSDATGIPPYGGCGSERVKCSSVAFWWIILLLLLTVIPDTVLVVCTYVLTVCKVI